MMQEFATVQRPFNSDNRSRGNVKLSTLFAKLARRIVGLTLLGAIAGCTAAPSLPPGYIAVGLENGPITLDPRFATDATASQVGDLLFDGLTRLDDQSRRLPQLAARWEVPDPQTYIFHLHDGFRFGNGEPVTAADVKATYEAIRDPRAHSAKQQEIEPIESVDVLDRLTVRFRLRYPFASFLSQTGIGILPASQIAASPTKPLAQPIGSGPFRLVEFLPDDRLVLARNPNYPLGAPRLAGVVFIEVPDAVSRLLELKRGTLDLVQNGIDPDSLAWLRKQPNITIVTGPSTTFQYLGMNLREPPLSDLRVRQAITHAIDRNAIVDTILKGLATPATGLLPPTHWAYSADVTTYAYNPKRAKELLDEAGYTDPDGDGPDPRFRLSYKTTVVELRRRIAEVLQGQLAQVGIALDIRSYEWATFYNDIKRGDFQLYSLAWVGIEDPDIYYLTCHSSQTPPQGSNRGGFHEETIDTLTEAGRRALSPGERRRLYGEVQRRVSQLLPIIPLWWPTNVTAMNRRLKGFELRPNASYVSLKDAWVEE
jgi:peptide/nickel transport system substrate-binding protein